MTNCDHPTTLLDRDGRCVLCTDDTARPIAPPRARRGPPRLAVERELLRRSFKHFVARYWSVVTGVPYVENRATRTIITTLQRVADGELLRVLIALPPGVGKSTLLALYAAWRLARDPSWRSLHASHAHELATTESRRVRRLVESDEFKAMFPAVVLRADENTTSHWATTSDGRYIAAGRDTALTGRRARELVVDDPLNATDRHSKAAREGTWTWLTEGLLSRLDGDRAPTIIVAQRLDRDDLIGRLIEQGGWHLVELPAEFDDGELLAPTVLTREKLDALKASIGPSTYATQYLQRPSDDDSATVKRAWWRFHHHAHVAPNAPRPTGCNTGEPAVATPDHFDRIVIAVDMTFGGTKASNDYAVAQVWGSVGPARYLLDMWRKRATQLEQQTAIKSLAARYPTARVIIEKAAGGAGAIEALQAAGIQNVFPVMTGGRSKDERLGAVSATIENGHALLPLGATWLADFVEELAGASRHDDMQDAAAYALAELNRAGTDEIATKIADATNTFKMLGHSPEAAAKLAAELYSSSTSTKTEPASRVIDGPSLLEYREYHAAHRGRGGWAGL